jgi:predicted Zn-ribbon and HTH transcriptional regulator
MNEKVRCKRCGYEWHTRTEGMPRQCPACKSYRWNKAKEKEARK